MKLLNCMSALFLGLFVVAILVPAQMASAQLVGDEISLNHYLIGGSRNGWTFVSGSSLLDVMIDVNPGTSEFIGTLQKDSYSVDYEIDFSGLDGKTLEIKFDGGQDYSSITDFYFQFNLYDLNLNLTSLSCIEYGGFVNPFQSGDDNNGYLTLTPSRLTISTAFAGLEFTSQRPYLKFKIEGTPPVPQINDVSIDIKPGSYPNPLNVNSRGVLTVAILGTEDFDVLTIVPASIRLEGVALIRSCCEDIEEADGYTDLVLKFKTQEVVAVLGDVADGDEKELNLTGDTDDGTKIVGSDTVIIKMKGKAKKSK